MNTKQFLYDTLKSQLDIKETECKQYDNNVYNPALIELKTEINRWFVDSVKATYSTFEFNGNEIEIISSEADKYDFRIRLRLDQQYRSNSINLIIGYSGRNTIAGDEIGMNHLKLLSEIADKGLTIENLFKEKWKPKLDEINENRTKSHNGYTTLNDALNKLLYEIKNDKIEEMKQIGFEITSFKKAINCSYDNELIEQVKSIQIQYGRSQYDTTYIIGFKVLGKKGNKYNIEIYRENSPSRIYDVLEKKFDNFIDQVCEWEYREADKYNERSKKRYNERKKAA
jgi:hypothetical protein